MITLEDCVALCGLSEVDVLAIAEHEHIPEIAAAAVGAYLLHQEHGAERISDMLRDDIRAALARNDRAHARELFMALRHFLSTHPEANGIGAKQSSFRRRTETWRPWSWSVPDDHSGCSGW